jgi:hypothetical protein
MHTKISNIEKERIKEKVEVEKFKMAEEQNNKQMKNLYAKLREANSELSFTKDTLDASNAKVKQL